MTIVNDTNNSNNNDATTNSNNKGVAVRTPTPTVAPALLFPGFSTARRYSDSHQMLQPKPTISVSLAEDESDEDGGVAVAGLNRRRANSYSPLMSHNVGNNNWGGGDIGEEIVCSTGELMNLQCLSRSAMEMRALQNHEFGPDLGSTARRGSMFHDTGNNNYANHQRSRSFDACIGKKSPVAKSNLLTGLFNRIKVGVGAGGTVGVASSSSPPTEGDDGCSSSTSTSTHAPPTTPVATTTTVVVVDPSGCGPTVTTLSPTPCTTPRNLDKSAGTELAEGQRRGNKEGIPWDNNRGYFLDASMLGLAIENHLKNGDKGQKRRATFCTLSETNSQLLRQPCSSGQTLETPTNRPRSASAYSVLPFLHTSGGGPVDPEMITRRRESIASVFPSSSGFPPQGRRNSSFTSSSGAGSSTEPNFYNSPNPDEVIVGSFIKTSMTSELYSDGEVIMEEEQLDIENYDNQTPQNVKNVLKTESTSSFLGGMDFWSNKPTETIINLFSSATSSLRNPNGNGGRNSRFSFSSQPNHRVSVTTINEEEEEPSIGGGGADGGQPNQRQNTICGFFRNVIMQIINGLFRS